MLCFRGKKKRFGLRIGATGLRIEPDGPDDVVLRKTIGIDAQIVGFRSPPFAIGKEIVVRGAVLFGFADGPARLVFVP